MNCHYCNSESTLIAATGTCAVCGYPTCSRPSGRSDNKFHGETCRHTGCRAFVCIYDTHQHTGSGVGHGTSLPQTFPLLTVSMSLSALSAAEATFGSRAGAPLDQQSNAALTEYAGFSAPQWRLAAIRNSSDIVSSFVERGHGERVGLRLMKGEYFDARRVAHLALNAAVMLFLAWRTLNAEDRRGFESYLPRDVVRRIERFAGALGSEKKAELTLQPLSDRLYTFVLEALAAASKTLRAPEVLDFRIREEEGFFAPSRRLQEMPVVLELQAAAGMLGAGA